MRLRLAVVVVLAACVESHAAQFIVRNVPAVAPSCADGTLHCVPTYFVDFTAGSDSSAGTSSSSPWKHSPGDANATGNANITLAAGNTVAFKGGVVYSGRIDVNASGSSGNPITFISGDRASPTWGSGRGIVDGENLGGTRSRGFYLDGKSWIDIEGLEIRNFVGVANTNEPAGVFIEANTGSPANDRVRYCVIHNVNWSSPYVIGYGIENNHGSFQTYEYNEIYNVTDKAIETWGNGGRGTADANHNIIRYNILHNTAVHSVVLSSDDDQFYGNIIWQTNDGTITGGGGTPNPGYCLKVDQGSRNVIYNNICYTSNAGFGVLVGDDNKFYSNTIYNVGGNGSGTHGSNDEVCFSLFYNASISGPNAGQWSAPYVLRNEFSNNLCDFLAGSGQPSDMFVYLQDDGGTGNLIKSNHFFKTSGDTTSTADRVRHKSGGSNAYGSIANLESNFNTWEAGSGNVASGNTVGDPVFTGGAYNSVSGLPTGFNSGTTTPNATGLKPDITSPARTGGLTLGSPYDVDITGAARSSYSRGAYEVP